MKTPPNIPPSQPTAGPHRAPPEPPARQSGMEAALGHAGPEFKTAAFTWIYQWARSHQVMVPEEVSDAYLKAGLPTPPDLRAFGSLWRKAVADGVVKRLDCNGWSLRRASPTYRYRSLIA